MRYKFYEALRTLSENMTGLQPHTHTNSFLQKISLLCKLDCMDISKGRLVSQHFTIDEPHHTFFHQSLKYQK